MREDVESTFPDGKAIEGRKGEMTTEFTVFYQLQQVCTHHLECAKNSNSNHQISEQR